MKTFKRFVAEAREPSPVAGTRKIAQFEHGPHKAEVRYNGDWEEYQVHHYKDGKHLGEGPVSYHGKDKADAMETAQHVINKHKEASK